MKGKISKLVIVAVFAAGCITAQTRKSLTVLSLDTKSINVDPASMGQMVRMELEKLNLYSVTDKYDVQQLADEFRIAQNCFGRRCLLDAGRKFQTDYIFSGSAEQLGQNLVITYRLYNVVSGELEKSYVHEFLFLPEEIRNMVKLSLAEMMGQPFEDQLMSKLTRKFDYDNSSNNPKVERLMLDGPRLGVVGYTGLLASRMTSPKSAGGFDVFPAMFQFGYQFEKQYLNEGKVQALFEFIPMITGLDQGYFIPSFAVMHGVRSNVNGWEFAIGPSLTLIQTARGYFDAGGDWQLESTWNKDGTQQKNPHTIEERIDSRGIYQLTTALVIGAGRTLKSGKMNIPVNVFVVPGKNGWRFGASFGFNSKNKT